MIIHIRLKNPHGGACLKFIYSGVQLALLALVAVLPHFAFAHEFWLDPVDFAPKVGAEVPVVQRTGINFLGDSFPHIQLMSKRFSVLDARGERPIKAVEGDDPAGDAKFPNAGLAIIVYERAPDVVTHPTIERFTEIVAIEGLEHIALQHREERLPLTEIKETYARFAKSLIKVGKSSGADRAVGLTFELVVEADVYKLPANADLPVRVLLSGKPVENVLVKAFNLADKTSPRTARSDADGRVTLTGVPPGEVLVSAVTMFRSAPATGALWTSLWASTTFKRP
jgi:Domain of unknown function (DUF4198)